MSDIKVVFKGGRQFAKTLIAMSEATKKETKKLVKEYGAKLQKEEMRIVPVAKKNGGTLKRSIMLTFYENGGRLTSYRDAKGKTETKNYQGPTAIVEPKAEYGGYVEYGTRFMSAQPYIRPSINKVTPEFIAAIKRKRLGIK